MTKLEECPKCGSNGFLVARDMLSTRHCCKCMSTWPCPSQVKDEQREAHVRILEERIDALIPIQEKCVYWENRCFAVEELLRRAVTEIKWWAEEHGCCGGHETKLLKEIAKQI